MKSFLGNFYRHLAIFSGRIVRFPFPFSRILFRAHFFFLSLCRTLSHPVSLSLSPANFFKIVLLFLISLLQSWVKSFIISYLSIYFFFNGPTPASFVYFCSFQTQILQKNCRLQQDPNPDRRIRRHERWPLDHHRGPQFTSLPRHRHHHHNH